MKTRAVLFAVVASVTTVSCGREVVVIQAPPETVAVTTTVASTVDDYVPSQSVSDEDYFLTEVAAQTTLDLYVSDSQLLETGYMVCDFFAAGGTPDDLAGVIYDAGTQSGVGNDVMLEYATLAGIALNWLCPEYA